MLQYVYTYKQWFESVGYTVLPARSNNRGSAGGYLYIQKNEDINLKHPFASVRKKVLCSGIFMV